MSIWLRAGLNINLQSLNLWNNQIEELPTSLSSLSKLRILNLGSVCRGFVKYCPELTHILMKIYDFLS